MLDVNSQQRRVCLKSSIHVRSAGDSPAAPLEPVTLSPSHSSHLSLGIPCHLGGHFFLLPLPDLTPTSVFCASPLFKPSPPVGLSNTPSRNAAPQHLCLGRIRRQARAHVQGARALGQHAGAQQRARVANRQAALGLVPDPRLATLCPFPPVPVPGARPCPRLVPSCPWLLSALLMSVASHIWLVSALFRTASLAAFQCLARLLPSLRQPLPSLFCLSLIF